jgi:hypothetical protein
VQKLLNLLPSLAPEIERLTERFTDDKFQMKCGKIGKESPKAEYSALK